MSNPLCLSPRTVGAALVLGLLGACGSTEGTPAPRENDAHSASDTEVQTSAPRDQADPTTNMRAPSGTDGAGSLTEAPSPAGPSATGCATFDSSFEAIQKLVFDRHGCSAAACHGEAKVGGLDLRLEASYEGLVDVASTNSAQKRVQPGAPGDSYLFQKLRAATEPGSVSITGSPMPLGGALSEDELEAVKLWIAKGAPKTGAVSEPTKNIDVGTLLDACLPAATPVKIKPLEPPPPETGIQLRLPPYSLAAGTETEHCIPFAFDFTDKVPARYKDEARNVLYTNGSRVRQDPQSHHMVVWNPQQDLGAITATDWTCHGGDQDKQPCVPSQGSADCGDGVCAGPAVGGTFCNGDITPLASGGTPTLESLAAIFDLFAKTGGTMPGSVASTQTPQQYTPPLPGIYTEIPLRGILWFNSHAFNLTAEDTVLEARVNFEYATERVREMRLMTDSSKVYIAEGTAPFTRKTFCHKTVVEQHDELATLSSHTHRRGEHFWVNDPAGKRLYDSFDYSDPTVLRFETRLTFDAADVASRTLEYCATFNNGLTKDDEPDISLVTRASRMPERTSCTPVACVGGKVMAACSTDADCDSEPGQGDGDCDACAIKGGPTTENEMFALMPWYVMPARP
jgi:hypothetical protein